MDDLKAAIERAVERYEIALEVLGEADHQTGGTYRALCTLDEAIDLVRALARMVSARTPEEIREAFDDHAQFQGEIGAALTDVYWKHIDD
jgi:hypothetical protein